MAGHSRTRSATARPTPLVGGGAGDRVAAWEALAREIRACRKCPLGALRTHAVVYRGSLTPRVVFVGEAPGAAEDRAGAPFVGPSGKRLDGAIRALGLADDDFGVLNLIKCRPRNNRFDPLAARTCRPYLDRQLALLRPGVLVTLGGRALAALDPAAPPVLVAAGRPRESRAPPLFPMLHPAAAMRSRRWDERWRDDLRRLTRWWNARSGETL